MVAALRVPILIRDTPGGAVYLTDKPGGEFDDGDEEWLLTIAAWASIAIEHERLLAAADSRQQGLERAVRRLEAMQAIAVAVGAETDLARGLELVAENGLAIVGARDVVILLQDGDELVVTAAAGVSDAQLGARIPIAGSRSSQAMVRQEPSRVMDVRHLQVSPERLGCIAHIRHSAVIGGFSRTDMWCRTPMTTTSSGANLRLVRTSVSRKDVILSFLSPANAPLLLLVVPIALVGWRWGLWWAMGIAGVAVALLLAPIWTGARIDVVGYLTRTTTFVTVAVLAGALHSRADPGAEDVGSPVLSANAPGSAAEDVLSPRELEVLAMVAEGSQNSEIANRLTIAETTVQSHVQHILHKLGVRNRTEAAALYLRG